MMMFNVMRVTAATDFSLQKTLESLSTGLFFGRGRAESPSYLHNSLDNVRLEGGRWYKSLFQCHRNTSPGLSLVSKILPEPGKNQGDDRSRLLRQRLDYYKTSGLDKEEIRRRQTRNVFRKHLW